jgi:hypothetical protein
LTAETPPRRRRQSADCRIELTTLDPVASKRPRF